MKFDFFKNILSGIVNCAENRVPSRNIRKVQSAFSSYRSLRLENLEDRQLLSVTPNRVDLSLNNTEELPPIICSESAVSIPVTEALPASCGESGNTGTSEGAAENYVVIFSGGIDGEQNYQRYYESVKELYVTVTSVYNVDPENIFILYADGTDPAKDQNIAGSNETPRLINSDMSFATGDGASVTSATYENFLSVMQLVGEKMDGNDHLFLYTSDHGGGDAGVSEKIGEEVICAWEGEEISRKDFADAVFNVDAGYVTIVETQCFSGGILNNIIDPETGNPVQETNAHWYGMAAANHYEYSYGKDFHDGLNKYLINHNASTAITVDAFLYAKQNDASAAKSEVYANNEGIYEIGLEHPWGIGESFTIFAAIQLSNPKNVSASVEKTTCSIQWSAVNYAAGYTVQYRLADSEGEWSNAKVNGTTARFTGVSGASYSVRIKANGNNAEYSDSAFSNIGVTMSASEPVQLVAPANLTAAASGTVISVNWDAVSEAAGYTVQYRQTGVEEEWSDADVIGRTATFTGKSQTGYSIRVKALGDKTVYTDSNFSETTVTAGIENTAENYVVLFSGGVRDEINYRHYYDTIKSLYNTVIDVYDVDPENIYVFNSDGTDEEPDMNIGVGDNLLYINSDMTFATEKGSQVNSANYAEFLAVMEEIGSKMDDNDHLLLYVSDHGGGTHGDPEVEGEETISLWKEQAMNRDEFQDAVFKVTAGYVTIIVTECFSGGMLASVIDPDTGISLNPNISKEDAAAKWYGMAAVNHYEYSWVHYNTEYSEEYQQYIRTEGGTGFHTGILNDLAEEIDLTTTVFTDAKVYDRYYKGEIYVNNAGNVVDKEDTVEHPWETGASFSIFAKDESNKLAAPENIDASVDGDTITVTWDAVEYATCYTLEYCIINEEDERDWTVCSGLEETSYLLSDLSNDSIYSIRVRAVDSTETWKVSDFAETEAITPLSEWNLANKEYNSYTEFRVDATSCAAYLYGILDEDETQLIEVPIVKGTSDLTILGDITGRLITISIGAMENLGTLTYNGKGGQIVIEGSDDTEHFTIDHKVTVEEQEIANPYAAVLKNFEELKDRRIISQAVYNTIKANYDKAYELYKAAVGKKTETIYETVSLAGRATLLFNGVSQATIDAKGENDTFCFKQLNFAYNLIGGEGEDRIDFSDTSRVVLNMGVTCKQYAVSGQTGSVRLSGDIEQVTGSCFNDVITSADNTTYINGGGGSDSLILKGTEQTITTVDLNGQNQNVAMRGDGFFSVNIENGTGSVINAASVSAKGMLYLFAAGDRVRVYGSAGGDVVNVVGDNAAVHGNSGDDILNIIGSNAIVHGNNGDDLIIISRPNGQTSENNFAYGDAGNDTVNLRNTDGKNYAYAGCGNDLIIGGDGVDYLYAQSGDNVLIGYDAADWLFGGCGRDLLIANTTQKMEEALSEDEDFYNKLAADWFAGNDITELLGTTSTRDNDRDWLTRGAGKNNVLYSNRSDNDYALALEFNPFNDRSFTGDDKIDT